MDILALPRILCYYSPIHQQNNDAINKINQLIDSN